MWDKSGVAVQVKLRCAEGPARARVMFLWVAHKAVDICNSGADNSEDAKLRATTMWALEGFVRLLDRSDTFLSEEDADRASLLGEYYLCCYIIVCDVPLSRKRYLGLSIAGRRMSQANARLFHVCVYIYIHTRMYVYI